MTAEKQSVELPSMSGMNVLSNGRSAGRFVGRAIRRATDVRNECVNGQATKLEVRQAVTLGLSRPECSENQKVIRLLLIIHNGIILDLVCVGFGGSVDEDVRADFSLVVEKSVAFYLRKVRGEIW